MAVFIKMAVCIRMEQPILQFRYTFHKNRYKHSDIRPIYFLVEACCDSNGEFSVATGSLL